MHFGFLECTPFRIPKRTHRGSPRRPTLGEVSLKWKAALRAFILNSMTERLYYADPKLMEFDAAFVGSRMVAGQLGLIFDRTAFYPTSGGQLFDTGCLDLSNAGIRTAKGAEKIRVFGVEDQDGDVLHFVDLQEFSGIHITDRARIRGIIDAPRRRDHMQQHTGQHLLSAVFIQLCSAPTVSFHMGDESCTIDLDAKSLTPEELREVERRSNEIITNDVPVEIKFTTVEEAKALGVRKIPPDIKDTLRLIEIKGHDLTACGGTHVSRTGEIGAILLRKIEKVKQGVRVEFVCGGRAVTKARRDYEALTSAAGLFSCHIYDVPEQIRKATDEAKAAGKREQRTLAELAEFMAAAMLHGSAGVPPFSEQGTRVKDPCHTLADGTRIVKQVFSDRDVNFIKLLAQKLAAQPSVIALLACTAPSPSLVFSQTPCGRFDMGALMKKAMTKLGGRGGGSRDLAQGGAPAGADVEGVLDEIATKMIT